MSERFIITGTDYIYDTADRGIYPTLESVVKTMNDQHEQIQELQRICTESEKGAVKILLEIQKENEELKQQLKDKDDMIGELKYSKKILRGTNKDLERSIVTLRKSFDNFDKMRVEHIRFLQKRMKKYGISIYYNDDE